MAHREQPAFIDTYFWRVFRYGVRLAWAAAVAWIPIEQLLVAKKYARAIGCPPVGECYVDGWLLHEDMGNIALASAALLWPYLTWVVLIRPSLKLVRHPSQEEVKPSGDEQQRGENADGTR